MVFTIDQQARKRIHLLEEQGIQRDREIAGLCGWFSRFAANLVA
jgi:hypothetical protein